MKSLACFAFCSGVAALAGCSSQVDPEYQGEPLAVISGAVHSEDVELDGLVPALGWYNFGVSDDEQKGDAQPILLRDVEVDGAFPNRFTMRVYDLPPEAAMAPASDGEPAAAMAMIFAARRDADWNDRWAEEPPEWLAGAAVNYMLLYLEGETRADGPAAHAFGEQLDAGYHLVEIRALTDEEQAERDACLESVESRAIAAYNAEYGTNYTSWADVPEEQSEVYSDFESAEETRCPRKAKMEIVPSGLEHPVTLEIGPDLEFVEWN